MKFLTWAHPRDLQRVLALLHSAAARGVTVEPIPCYGLLDKLASLHNALRCIPDAEEVVCTDGFDCLYVQGQSEMLSRLSAYGRDILFSGQSEPDHHLPSTVAVAKQLNPNLPYPIPNSGIIAGRCDALRAMLSEIMSWDQSRIRAGWTEQRPGKDSFNDQTLFGHYFALNSDRIAIDAKGSFAWTSAYEDDVVDQMLNDQPFVFKNPLSGEVPCIFHLPCTSPGVYAQFLWAYLSLGLPATAKEAQLVRLEELCREPGHPGRRAQHVLKMFRAMPGFRQERFRQYLVHYYRQLRMLLGRGLRRLGVLPTR